MSSSDCPEWEYETVHDYSLQLQGTIQSVLVDLRNRVLDSAAHARDTRDIHRRFFNKLTPRGYPYYAGHYRGEDFPCLIDYWVTVRGDPRVGAPPVDVQRYISELSLHIVNGIEALDVLHSPITGDLPEIEKIVHTVRFSCRVFEWFLRVHPYANGNGHVARFVIWSILGRYGLWPNRWSIEPRPPGQYIEAIEAHRDGDPARLEKLVLESLAPVEGSTK
jgi:fido (protein-threonine AMPylation protein)